MGKGSKKTIFFADGHNQFPINLPQRPYFCDWDGAPTMNNPQVFSESFTYLYGIWKLLRACRLTPC